MYALVQSSGTQWATYEYESQTMLQNGAGAMLAAGEPGLAFLRQIYPLTFAAPADLTLI